MKTELLIKTGSRQCRHLIAVVALSLTAATASADTIQTSDTLQAPDIIQTFNAVAADPDSCFIGQFAGHALFIPNVDTSFTVNILTATDDGFRYRFTPNPGTFVEDLTTGTATLTGSLNSTNPSHLGYGFDVTLNLSGRTNVPPPGSPFISGELMPSCYVSGGGTVDPATWHYYPVFTSAVLLGTGHYAGAHLTLTQFMHAIQVGAGANSKNVQPGVAGWFMWHVDTQPTNPSFVLRDSTATGVYGDFDFNISNAQALGHGDTATIGFWHNRNGQALILSLNGGPNSTALGNWLATTFPCLYGAQATSAVNLTGKSNTYVAAYYLTLFGAHGQKTYAQILATALASYATSTTLAGGNYAAQYGFNVSPAGTGARTVIVGGTTYTVLQLLLNANTAACPGHGVLSASDFNLYNTIFDGINQSGDIQ